MILLFIISLTVVIIALNGVLEIGKQKDLIVFLGYMMRFEGNFDIEILNTNKIVHNRQELIKEMIIADGMLNSGIYERPEFI